MRYLFLFLSFSVFLLSGCDRDDDEPETVGIVLEHKGCYPDSYLVQLVGREDKRFSCPDNTPVYATYNCTNAVFVHLSPALGVVGKKIRFVYGSTEASCLSSSGTPPHIIVKSVRAD